MRVARKLTIALVLAVCAVLTVHGYLTSRRERAFFEADTQRDARVMGRALAAVVSEVWRAEGEARALQMIGEANEREASVNFRYVSLMPEAPARPSVPLDRIGTPTAGRESVVRVLDNEGTIFTYVPLPIAQASRGAIEISSSLAEQRKYVRFTLFAVGLTTATTMLLAAGLTMLLGAWFVGRPMRELIAKARRIGNGDLTGPLRLRQHDELGELASEINAMCDRLAEERIARARAVDELRHAHRLAVVGRLASGVAHELGTPLHVVSGWADMIVKREVEGEAAIDAARNVSSAASRMAAIIRQLLDFARRRVTTKEPHSLFAVVQQTTTLLAPIAEKRRVEVTINEPPAPIEVEVDATQLQQAITNLVMNGIEAMRDGGRLTIDMAVEQMKPPAEIKTGERTWAVIEIRDNGPGMSRDILEQVFEPFFTTKGVGEGTGLGLSVSYGIVQEHGGWIAVESTPGHGTCFRVFLPAPRGRGET
jgi:two-component system, NtrC family, sensor kinase